MRVAADELRRELAGDTVTFVVNRNINVSNICIVGCAFCGFGQARRSPDAYVHSEEEFARRVSEAVEFGATEICMQSGIHPDWGLEDYEHWLRFAKEIAGRAGHEIHLHAYSPMEIAHMCDVSGLRAAQGVRAAARGRTRLDSRNRGRGPARRRPRAHLPEQAAGRSAGSRSSRLRTPRGCARPRP